MIRWLAENLVISIQSVLQDIAQSNLSKQEKRNAVTTILNLKSVKEKKTPRRNFVARIQNSISLYH